MSEQKSEQKRWNATLKLSEISIFSLLRIKFHVSKTLKILNFKKNGVGYHVIIVHVWS